MKEESELEKRTNAERVFLHDVSNHLVIAQGMIAYIKKQLDKTMGHDSKEVIRIAKAKKAVEDISNLLRARRSLIKTEI